MIYNFMKKNELYRGKAKTLYSTNNLDLLMLEFRNDISAENGLRIEQFDRKGIINNKFNYYIMNKLKENGISTHLVRIISDNMILVKKLTMIPIEFVIRNRAAGSLVKRLGIKEGVILNPPLFDLFLKNDKLNDPIINESYCITFGLINKKDLTYIYNITLKINEVLNKLFDNIGLILIDFKLEFGFFHKTIILGDEFSLDNARIWNKVTMNKMDKDRFRYKLGNIIETYEEVLHRLGIT